MDFIPQEAKNAYDAAFADMGINPPVSYRQLFAIGLVTSACVVFTFSYVAAKTVGAIMGRNPRYPYSR